MISYVNNNSKRFSLMTLLELMNIFRLICNLVFMFLLYYCGNKYCLLAISSDQFSNMNNIFPIFFFIQKNSGSWLRDKAPRTQTFLCEITRKILISVKNINDEKRFRIFFNIHIHVEKHQNAFLCYTESKA